MKKPRDWRDMFYRVNIHFFRSLEDVADRLYDLGFTGYSQGADFLNDAIKYYKLLLDSYAEYHNIEYDPYYAKLLNKLGFSYFWLSFNYTDKKEDYQKALEYFFEAEKVLSHQPRNLYELLITYQGIIYCLIELGNEKCKEYIEKAHKLARDLNLETEVEWIKEAESECKSLSEK